MSSGQNLFCYSRRFFLGIMLDQNLLFRMCLPRTAVSVWNWGAIGTTIFKRSNRGVVDDVRTSLMASLSSCSVIKPSPSVSKTYQHIAYFELLLLYKLHPREGCNDKLLEEIEWGT